MSARMLKTLVFVSTIQLLVAGYAHAGWLSHLFASNGQYANTKYSIVLVGGFFAFDSMLGIEYFYGIADDLRKYGANVYETDVSEFHNNEFRGEELLREIEDYLAITGYEKVNVIAHSQGSATARYVASARPDLIASITSVHGMNRGTYMADSVRGIIPAGSIQETLLEAVTNFVGGPLWGFISGDEHQQRQSAIEVMNSSNTEAAQVFNRLHTAGLPSEPCGRKGAHNVNGVRYWSWGGAGGRFGANTNPLDILDDVLFSVTPYLFPKGVEHDGVVQLCSQYLGKPIRHDYYHNHIDAVNHFLGVTGVAVKPKTLYRNHANRLKKAGL
ncbi:MAG: alpha/beta fold hydrolase [Pseudomonadales bacterium]|nr:alpha/beta fold hydrolase [Pseudomonadales bacterium]